MTDRDSTDLSADEHRKLAQELLERWQAGESKSRLEVEYWDDATSHGKAFSGYVRKWLEVETEGRSPQSQRISELESRLRLHGVSPNPDEPLTEDFRLLAVCREAALAALRVYNDPTAGFRTQAFALLMIVAWNALFQAMLERRGVDYLERDENGQPILIDHRPKVLDTAVLMGRAIGESDRAAMRANLDFFLKLRNLVAHRYLPAVDVAVVSEAQALLRNLEKLLVEQFGPEATLGEKLSVPLYLSEFQEARSLQSLKDLQARLPPDVMEFLNRHRRDLPDEVVRDSEYALRLFFVPVAANRERSAEAVVHFLRPESVTPELEEAIREMAVVTKPKRVPVVSDGLLRPTEVVQRVRAELPHRFTTDTHTRAWKYFNVRPPTGSAEPAATDDRYCLYDFLSRQYGYTEAWVGKLLRELKDLDTYRAVAGYRQES